MITVVIPAYQAESYISAAIRTAQAQTLKPSTIIVVDDGSTDDTANISEELGATVIRQANGGVAKARNVGLSKASTEWVALLDADDVWEPKKLQKQMLATQLCPNAAFVSCNNYFFESGKRSAETYLDKLGSDYFLAGRKELNPGVAVFDLADFRGLNWIVPSPSSLLIKRDVFKSIGYFDEELNGVDDTEFYLRAMGSYPFVFLEEPLTGYRQLPDGLSQNQLLCKESFLKAIEKIGNSPEAYPPGVSETAGKVKADRLASYGQVLLRLGRYSDAREALQSSFQARLNLRALILWMAAAAHIKI